MPPFPTMPTPLAWTDRRHAFVTAPEVIDLDGAARSARLRHLQPWERSIFDLTGIPGAIPYPAWQAQREQTRALAADLLFAGDVDGLAMVPSAAFGLATAARNLRLRHGQSVLVMAGQFPSNLLPWQQRCAEVGATIVAATPHAEESLTDALLRTLDAHPQIAIAALSHCDWNDGRLLDLDRVSDLLQARGIALVLDLSQSLGVLPVALTRWQPAFVVSVGYKWLLGGPGLAWLWASPHWREAGASLDQHWLARDPRPAWNFPVDSPAPQATGARRFDAGGVGDPLALALAQGGLAQVQAWGLDRIALALGEVTHALDDALERRGLRDWMTPGHAPHLTGLRVPAGRLDAVATALSHGGVLCSRKPDGLRLAPSLAVMPEQTAGVVAIAAGA